MIVAKKEISLKCDDKHPSSPLIDSESWSSFHGHTSCCTSVSFEHRMCVKSAHNRRWRRVRTSLRRLASDTEQVRDEIAIHQMCGVCDKDGEVIAHVEAWTNEREATRTGISTPGQ